MNSATDLVRLIDTLRSADSEHARLEFKVNNADPEMIGERVSGLANSARLHGHERAYLLWGVEDGTHAVVGTSFRPATKKVNNQPLEIWLSQILQPAPSLVFDEVAHPEGRVVVLTISAALTSPVRFRKAARIRIGEVTKLLPEYPDLESKLWTQLQSASWEELAARSNLEAAEVLAVLDIPAFFAALEQPIPKQQGESLYALESRGLVRREDDGRWTITNLGALSLAKQLRDFGLPIARKAVRFMHYEGRDRASNVIDEPEGSKGYVVAFEGVFDYVMKRVPANEHFVRHVRRNAPLFPPVAVRELVANALVHQDLGASGAGPIIELFEDRLEISNPGALLVDPDRIVDHAPRSRNEAFAGLMNEFGFCEERGRGADNALIAVEVAQLPPLEWRRESNSTRAVLRGPRPFQQMTTAERVLACYQHAVLQYLKGGRMQNHTLRERFGIADQNAAQASAVFRQTVEAGKIKLADPSAPKSGYVPYWV